MKQLLDIKFDKKTARFILKLMDEDGGQHDEVHNIKDLIQEDDGILFFKERLKLFT